MMEVVLNALLFFTLLICASGSQRETRVLMEEYSLESIVDKLNNLTARVEKCEAGNLSFSFDVRLVRNVSIIKFEKKTKHVTANSLLTITFCVYYQPFLKSKLYLLFQKIEIVLIS